MIGRRRRTTPVYTTVQRAGERYVSEQAGIRSLHSFSAGANYDPDNTAFGSLVGVDDHVLDPGAGFERHTHRGVAIVTWVVEGTLHHQDSSDRSHTLDAGQAAVQIAGTGVEHVEANTSTTEPVRFIQTTLLSDEDVPSYRILTPPFLLANALFDVHRSGPLLIEAARAHLFVAAGQFLVKKDGLYPGDSMRITTEDQKVEGKGELLVLLLR